MARLVEIGNLLVFPLEIECVNSRYKQIPAYEWNFGDVNPPVHAWAVFRTFKIERKMYGREDLDFLERVFQKLLLNFTWSVTPFRSHPE